MLNLDHLRTYALIIETGSFSGAAERLGLSQPAVSLQIRQLEQRLGLRLVERVARRATPTPAGLDLLAGIQQVNTAVDGVMAAMASHSSNVEGRVTLGTGATACLYLLPQILRSLRIRFPKLSVVVSTGNTADFVKAVEGNTLDLALVTLPVKRRALVTTPLLNDEFVAIASKREAPLPARITPAFLAKRELVLFEPAANTRVIIDQWFRDAGHAPKPVMELGSVEAIKEMVAAGLGCSILPAMAVTGPGQHPELVVHPLYPRLQRTLALVMRGDKPVNKAMRQVISAIEQRTKN
ncbi:LysR family transcriptional regulator [Polaromonas sp. YR568]|uniref:LysR family transcriptional regulator n=1 Tax=Polaromonas sp. YR568 TaxID=1855301 RepID=UPI00398C0B2A